MENYFRAHFTFPHNNCCILLAINSASNRYSSSLLATPDISVDTLRELYFELGIKYAAIVILLNEQLGYAISKTKLKCTLRI